MRIIMTMILTVIVSAIMLSTSVNAAHAVGTAEWSEAIAIVEAVAE